MSSPRRLPGLLVLALVVAACDGATVSPTPTSGPTPSAPASPRPSASTPTPAPTPTQDASVVYEAIQDAVIRLRGLEPRQTIEPQLLTEAELKARVEKSFSEDNPPDLIRANEVLLRALGMLAEDASLADLYVELLGSQVAGFYDPEADELYVVARSGGLGPSEKVTYAHEFTHALQDQHFDLTGFELDAVGQGDRSLARLSLIEGDATAAMSLWMQRGLTPQEIGRVMQESLDPESLAVLERMPRILRESLEFPYTGGLQFVLGLHARGGWESVDRAFAAPPATTEQVLHPEKYASGETGLPAPLPDDLAARMGRGWKVTLEDTFGEFQTQVWLRNAIRRVTVGNEAAAGWGGDRLAVLEGPDEAWAVVWRTVWDTDADAAEFGQAAADALQTGGGPSEQMTTGRDVWLVIASDTAVLGTAIGAAGQPTG